MVGTDLQARLNRRLENILANEPSVRPVAFIRRPKYPFRWAAAAAVLLIASGAYFISIRTAEQKIAGKKVSEPIRVPISAPSSSLAVLTLANGNKILLDSAVPGTLARQAGTDIIKHPNGDIDYQAAKTGEATDYNEIDVPSGSQVLSLILSDGTKVWLDAASSLRYPVAFTGKERVIEITGEGYFEVAHNAAMPFIVKEQHTGAEVRVLGTHFNVNAYANEGNMKVTLLEGSVKITHGLHTGMLSPGEQAEVGSQAIHIQQVADIDAVMSWKNGRFQFGEKADINSIMRQLARWYNVDVEYQGKVNLHFGGSISRTSDISQVLDKLEMTGAVKFKTEGRKIIVSPGNLNN